MLEKGPSLNLQNLKLNLKKKYELSYCLVTFKKKFRDLQQHGWSLWTLY